MNAFIRSWSSHCSSHSFSYPSEAFGQRIRGSPHHIYSLLECRIHHLRQHQVRREKRIVRQTASIYSRVFQLGRGRCRLHAAICGCSCLWPNCERLFSLARRPPYGADYEPEAYIYRLYQGQGGQRRERGNEMLNARRQSRSDLSLPISKGIFHSACVRPVAPRPQVGGLFLTAPFNFPMNFPIIFVRLS